MTAVVSPTSWTEYINGTNKNINFTYTSDKFKDLHSKMGIGSRLPTKDTQFTGYMAEVICYNSTLSTIDRQYIEGYLAWKWGIRLPTEHPYYSIAPPIPGYYTPVNMLLWLDANDPYNTGETPTTNTRITTWKDKSGGGRNATATNAPTTAGLSTAVQWKDNSNGTPGFYFDSGVTSSLNFNSSNISITNNQITVFIVSSFIEGTYLYYARSLCMTSGSGVPDYDNTSSVGFLRYGTTRYNPSTNGVTLPYDNSLLYNSTFVNYYQYDGSKVYANILIGSSTVGDVSANNTGNFNISYLSIGSMPNTNDKMTGYIHEILVYNTALNNTERRKIEGYLSWKWGLQSKLPSSHPYFSAAP